VPLKWTKVTPESSLSDEVYAFKINAETACTKRAALLQCCRMVFKKGYKRAVKGLAAAVEILAV